MKTRKIFLCLLLAMILTFVSAFAVACGDEPDDNVPEEPTKAEWPEAGIYYFDTDNDESTLTLNEGDTFSLYVKGEYQAGSYELKDSTLKLDFNAESKKDIVAEYNGSSITLTYEGSSIRFLKKIVYSVTFQTNGGSVTETQQVINGKYATKPVDPVKNGYVFVGWYLDEDFKTAYGFGAEPVTKGITLFARWSESTGSDVEYDVKLDANYDGAAALESVKTVGGKLFDLPTLERSGYTFGGWWFGSDNGEKLSHRYEDGMVLKGGDTLYALWVEAPEGTKLPSPIVTVSQSSISWDAVSGARSYVVTVVGPDGDAVFESTVSTTTVNVPFASYVAGQYEIKVVAQANSGEANNSESVRYFVNKALNKVSVFTVVEPSMLVFGGVENAERYFITVSCGNSEHEHTLFDNGSSRTFSFANCPMTAEGISFTVTAVADGYATSVSETFTYVRNLEPVYGFRLDEATEILSWYEVEGADSYMVSVTCGNAAHNHGFVNLGSATSVSLKECSPCEGGIVVKVYPKTNGYNSPAAVQYVYNKTVLPAPDGLLLKDTLLSWNAVEGATSYKVTVNGAEYTVSATEFDLDKVIDAFDGAEYELSVRAVGTTESLASDTVVAVYYDLSSGISYDKGILTWAPVIGADYYEVQVNSGAIVKVENGAYSAPVVLTQAGVNNVKVRFVDGKTASDWVQTQVYALRVTFDTLGGSEVAVQYKAVGDPIVLPTPEKAGFTFVDWYNVPGGASTNGTAYTDEFFASSTEMVLYAYYKSNKYEVTYNYGVGGSGSLTSDEVYFAKDYQLTVPTATDVAGAFGGWFSAPYGMGVRYTDEKGNSVAPWSSLENVELYAFWIDETLSFTLTRVNGKDAYAVSKGSKINQVTEVTIPASFKGIPVAFVAGNAFEGCSNLTVINLPATIEQISLISPFAGCTSLEQINVYDVEGVNDPRFSSVDGVLLDNGTAGRTSIAAMPLGKAGTYRVPANVTDIPETAFAGSSVTKVIIHAGVTRIGREAFMNCTNLSSVVFEVGKGEALPLSIGARAFMGCTSLTRITLPARLNDIKLQRYVVKDGAVKVDNVENAFLNCYNLSNISVAAGNQTYTSVQGVLYSKDGKTLILAPESLSGKYEVPEGTRTVAQGAFVGCTELTEVTLPGTLVLVGECAFYGLDNLTTVSFGGKAFSDLTVDKYAFRDCAYLESVMFGETSRVAAIGDGAFMGCESMEEFTLPATLTQVGEGAFADCSGLETVNFAQGGKELEFGKDAFKNCSSLTEVNLPANVSKIPGIFVGCTSLEAVNVDPDSKFFTSEDGVVYDVNKTELLFFPGGKSGAVTLPATLTTISAGVFQGISGVTTLTVPATLTLIGDSAFAGASFETIVFDGTPAGSLVIGDSAFEGASFNSLELPTSTVSLGNRAFYEVDADEVVLNEGLTTIGNYAFYYAKLDVTVPASVKIIGAYAFSGEDDLWDGFTGPSVTLVTANSQLESIGYAAFEYNSEFTEIVIPKTVKTIGAFAFSESGLEQIDFEADSALKLIGAYAFAKTDIESITIPKSVTEIGAYAFSYSALTEVVFEDGGTEPLVLGTTAAVEGYSGYEYKRGYAFANTDDLVSVVLPTRITDLGCYTFYYAGYHESELSVTIEGTGEVQLTTIGEGCFYGSSLVSFNVPKSVKNLSPVTDPVSGETYDRLGIGKVAFYGLYDSLTSLTFELGGTEPLTIGDNALERAKLLTEITLPARLSTYTSANGDVLAPLTNGARVFTDCVALTAINVEDAQGAYYASTDGVLITADGKEIVAFPAGREAAFTVPATVTGISERAFYNSKVTEITFAGGTEDMHIGSSAFANCSALTSLVLPDNVVSVGATVFYGCSKLESLTLSARLTGFDGSMVTNCTSLASVNVSDDGNGEYFSSANGVLYSADKTVLVMYPLAKADTEIVVDANVKVIAVSAFADNELIEKVVLPEGLVEINASAFEFCYALTEVNIPSTVQLIGKNAFRSCSDLAVVDFASEGTDPLIISDNAFESTSDLGAVAFPARLYTIGNYAFNNGGVSTVTFAEGCELVSIGNYAFNSSDLEKIAVPAGCVTIGERAFFDCSYLEEVELGEGLVSIGDHAFAGCDSLTSVSFPASLKTLGASVFFYEEYGAYDCPNLKYITFAPGCQLEYIPMGTFAYTAIESIVIPASVKYIEGGEEDEDVPTAFYECLKLESVTFERGSQCASIGDYTFYNCSALKEIELPTSVGTLGANVFGYCRGLESIVIPETVSTVGSGLFWGCESLTEVVIEAKLTAFPSSMFYGCASLTSIVIPETVTSIASNAFSNTGIASFEVDKDNDAFTSVDGVLYTKDLTSIVAFPPKSQNKDIVIPKEVTLIGENLFYKNNVIETVVFESGRTESIVIDEGAFRQCTALRSVVLPELLVGIGDYAFEDCVSLVTVTIAAGTPESAFDGDRCFDGCDKLIEICNLSSIKLEPGDSKCGGIAENAIRVYSEGESGISYTDDGFVTLALDGETVLVGYPVNETEIVIPDGVTAIYDGLFMESKVVSVTFPDSVTDIGDYTFYYCYYLEEVILPAGLTEIGVQTFYSCDNLATIELPASLKTIGAYAFNYSGLEQIVLPAGLETIGEEAFYGTDLEQIELPASLKTIGKQAFRGTNISGNIVIGDVQTIGERAFYDCGDITFVLPMSDKPEGWHSTWNEYYSGEYYLALWGFSGEDVTYTFYGADGTTVFTTVVSALPIDLPTEVPVLAGHVFWGWYDNAELTGEALTDGYYNTAKTSIYAKFITEAEYEEMFRGTSMELPFEAVSGQTYTVNLDAGEKMYLKITVAAGEKWNITSLNNGKDHKIYMYKADGTVVSLGSWNDYYDSGYEESFDYTFTEAGDYYIAVCYYYNSDSGEMSAVLTKK